MGSGTYLIGGGCSVAIVASVAGAYLLGGTHSAVIAGVVAAVAFGIALVLAGLVKLYWSLPRTKEEKAAQGQADQDFPVRSIMALFIVFLSLGGIVYLALAIGLASAESFAAIVNGVMGGVIGYYFGSQGVSHFQRTATRETEARATVQAAADARDSEVQPKLEESQRIAKEAASAFSFRTKLTNAARSDPDLTKKLETLLDDSDFGE
jgi:small-conductance mechanosensitive channel